MKPIFIVQIANLNNNIDGDSFNFIVQDIEKHLKNDYYVLVELCQSLEVSQYHLFSIDGVTETTIEELKKLLSIKEEIKINE